MMVLCIREVLQAELKTTQLKVDTLQLKKNIAESKVVMFGGVQLAYKLWCCVVDTHREGEDDD